MDYRDIEWFALEMNRDHSVIFEIVRWTGMGEFNSDDHYIYYCGQESLRRNGVAIIVNKRVQSDLACAINTKGCESYFLF